MKPRPLAPEAVAFLREHEASGLLDHFGGAQGVIDASEATAYLLWVFASLAWLFALASRRG